jgi:hypothetical protein
MAKSTQPEDNGKDTVFSLQPRIHLNEFLATTKLSPMQMAGFRVYVDTKVWMTEDEWQQHLDGYMPTKSK